MNGKIHWKHRAILIPIYFLLSSSLPLMIAASTFSIEPQCILIYPSFWLFAPLMSGGGSIVTSAIISTTIFGGLFTIISVICKKLNTYITVIIIASLINAGLSSATLLWAYSSIS